MIEVESEEWRKAVENMRRRTAALIQPVPVAGTFIDQFVQEATAHVFDMDGCPNAARTYKWPYPTVESKNWRFFGALHLGAIGGPVDAVRAAIAVEARAK